jgi:hypothetical protein
MFYKFKNFVMAIMTCLICNGMLNAATTMDLEALEKSGAIRPSFVVQNLPDGGNPEKREKLIQALFGERNVPFIDLSSSDIGDKDVEAIVQGLVIRKKQNGEPIKFLDISQKCLTKEGVEHLLFLLQQGYQEGTLPDISKTIMKISPSVNYSEELLIEWQDIAPFVFSGGLTIID